MCVSVGQNGKTHGSQLKVLSLIRMAKMKKLTNKIKMCGDSNVCAHCTDGTKLMS